MLTTTRSTVNNLMLISLYECDDKIMMVISGLGSNEISMGFTSGYKIWFGLIKKQLSNIRSIRDNWNGPNLYIFSPWRIDGW